MASTNMGGILDTLIWAVEQFNATHYTKAALMTLFVADYFHTVITEISFLWPAPWTIVKAVFFISRYSPFLDSSAGIAAFALSSPSVELCDLLLRIDLWSSGIGQLSAHILLIYRAYALVGRTRPSAILLSLLAVVVTVNAFTCLAEVNKSISVTSSPLPGVLPGCLIAASSTATNSFSIAGIIASIVYETILFATVYWAKVKKYKENRNELMRKIYGDAFIYYLISLVISTSGIVVWFASDGPIRELSSTVSRVLISIVSCRIILNIRKYGNEPQTFNANIHGGTGMGEIGGPTSRLHFEHSGRSPSQDTELGLQQHLSLTSQ